MHIGPTLIVFVAFTGLTLWSWVDANRNVRAERAQVISNNVEMSIASIQSRIATYEDVIRSGGGLFEASDSVSRSEWKRFVGVFDIQNRYPGTGGVGFIKAVPEQDRPEYIRAMSQQGVPNFDISPTGQRSSYAPITYFEPDTNQSQAALGYDMYSDPVRRVALEQARDTGQVTMTPPIQFLKGVDGAEHQGFMIFYPVYSTGTVPATKDEREARLAGYVYVPFRSQDFFGKILVDTNANFGFQVVSSSGDHNTILYDSSHYAEISNNPNNQNSSRSFFINGQQWAIVARVNPAVLSSRENNRPSTVLWGGLLFSAMVAAVMYTLLSGRTRRVAENEDGELQSAKDELLALASHQLRTPATGVKQYIGMLQEGYAGELNEQQKIYLDKANQSNERQLGTINEMLMVARADAGHLEINKTNFDLNELTEDVISEQLADIDKRSQSIKSYMPKEHIHINADIRYTRMAIENMISNATKYTPDKGELIVTLLRKKQNIHIAVRDTGVGISKDDYPLLFRKFSRIPNALTSKVGGTGIGLYLTQKIAKAHDGEITFTSTVDKGSVCTMILPVHGTRGREGL